MTTDPSDIVERLRKHSAMGGCYEAEQAMKEAAAEIERLRAALAAETERCAKVADEYARGYDEHLSDAPKAARGIAAAIRGSG